MKRSKNPVIDLVAACIKVADMAFEHGVPYNAAAKDGGVVVVGRTASVLLEKALGDADFAQSLIKSVNWIDG
ncbi:MAG: hypothetical protein AAB794_03475 [Patescibacteria group bacterium]